MSNKKVLIVGAAVIDKIAQIERLPLTGDDVYGEIEEVTVGGCGYNVYRMLDALEVAADFLAPIGTGPYAELIEAEFEKFGIEQLLKEDGQDNGWNISLIEPSGERTFMSFPGLEVTWQSAFFDDVSGADYDWIHLSGYEMEGESGRVIVQELTRLTEEAEAAGEDAPQIVFDPTPRVNHFDPELLQELYRLRPIVHTNVDELTILAGPKSASGEQFAFQTDNTDAETIWTDFVRGLSRKLIDETHAPVVVTDGAKGSYYVTETECEHAPAADVIVKNTSGAGDAHTAAFLAGLARGLEPEMALRLGNVAAADVISRPAPAGSDADIDELLARAEEL